MSATKSLLFRLAEWVERELGCDFDHAMTLVQDELEKGTPLVDVFDMIVDARLTAATAP